MRDSDPDMVEPPLALLRGLRSMQSLQSLTLDVDGLYLDQEHIDDIRSVATLTHLDIGFDNEQQSELLE